MKTKKLARNSDPAEPASPENRNSPVVSGRTSENIGDRGPQHQANNTNPQAQKQAKLPETAQPKQAPPQTSAGRFQRGQSGNPKGRPKNSPNKANQAVRAMLESSAPQLLAKAIELALAGNPTRAQALF